MGRKESQREKEERGRKGERANKREKIFEEIIAETFLKSMLRQNITDSRSSEHPKQD